MQNTKKYNIFIFISTIARNIIEVFSAVLLYKMGYSIRNILLFYFLIYFVGIFVNYISLTLTKAINPKYILVFSGIMFGITFYYLSIMPNTIDNLIIYSILFAISSYTYHSLRHYFALKVLNRKENNKKVGNILICTYLAIMLSSYFGAYLTNTCGLITVVLITIFISLLSIIPLLQIKNNTYDYQINYKETIKKMKNNVDVLTLSATPIPRTLNMSLTGIKDMSLIEEAPEERYPVQTYVLEQDDHLLRDVIERELGRGGQVFVVFNRVKGIQQIAAKIEALVPDAVVGVGHGQMNEHALENVMLDFIEGHSNVLVATTIVESGLDIPNANTMIVLDADHYGLSQLYQLRGRVGRSNRLAYAYLMYQKDKVLTEVAEKRLKAIREFTEFGAGFKVAMRDLEIRGAGNLLGTAQSGHMMNVGYELYCKMVDDAIRALQGEIVNERKEETSVEIPLSAYIPETYIENETLKLSMYKKIASVRTYEDEDEILDELLDRFGDVPQPAVNLVRIAHARYLAETLSVTRIYQEKTETAPGGRARTPKTLTCRPAAQETMRMVFQFAETNPLSGYALFNLTERFGQKVFVHGGVEPFIRLSTDRKNLMKDVLSLLELLNESKKSASR